MDAWIPPINGSREGFLSFVFFTGSQSNFRGVLCREKIPSNRDKQPAKQRCLGFFREVPCKQQEAERILHLPTAVGTHQTHLSPTPRCSQGSFPTFTRHRWKLELADIFPTALREDTQREKIPKQAPGLAKGGGMEKKPLTDGLRPKHARTEGKAGSPSALHCNQDNAQVLQPHCYFPLHLQLEIARVLPAFPRVLSLQVPGLLPLPWLDLSALVTVADVRMIPSDKVSAQPPLPCLLASLSRLFPHL